MFVSMRNGLCWDAVGPEDDVMMVDEKHEEYLWESELVQHLGHGANSEVEHCK